MKLVEDRLGSWKQYHYIENGKELAMAVTKLIDINDLKEILSDKFYFDNKAYNDLLNHLNKSNITKVLYLVGIENNSNIKGLGRKLFNEITKEHNCIILDPLTDVIDYWKKVGFEFIDNKKMYLIKGSNTV